MGARPKQKPKPPVKRQFMDRFNDDPKYIVNGEKMKFEIGAQTGSSGKKRPRQGDFYDNNRS